MCLLRKITYGEFYEFIREKKITYNEVTSTQITIQFTKRQTLQQNRIGIFEKFKNASPALTRRASTASITGDKSTYNTIINTNDQPKPAKIQVVDTWTEKIKPKAKTLIDKVKSKLEDRVSPAPEQK